MEPMSFYGAIRGWQIRAGWECFWMSRSHQTFYIKFTVASDLACGQPESPERQNPPAITSSTEELQNSVFSPAPRSSNFEFPLRRQRSVELEVAGKSAG